MIRAKRIMMPMAMVSKKNFKKIVCKKKRIAQNYRFAIIIIPKHLRNWLKKKRFTISTFHRYKENEFPFCILYN